MGRCPECDSWNSLVEEVAPAKRTSRNRSDSQLLNRPERLSDVSFTNVKRYSTKSAEFNRVLGGGIVPGSVILVGGDPGIGKSTLMLQEGVSLANTEFPVLYVSGEESTRQTKLRADRLAINSTDLYILAETDIGGITNSIDEINPKLVVIDSIQTVYQPMLDSSPGSISQVRECALTLSRIAKSKNIPVILVGHVTKDGYIAGPKALEHLVDVLLHFEGDREHFYRILRAVKNRFGSTREIGVFEMKPEGLQDVHNPSTLFLGQQKDNISGSAIICTMQGSRPFLVEIQALVTPTSYGMPQRTSTGIDGKRLSLLLAVLEKRIGLRLGTFDVFVNAVGGAKIDEPSADLGILVAIASSFKDEIIEPSTLVVGEIGLGGELRAVPQIEQRIEEAQKLGFNRVVIPEQNSKGLKSNGHLKVFGMKSAQNVLDEVLN